MNLTIQKNKLSHTKDRRFKPIVEKPSNHIPAIWLIDISSVAIRKQHKSRYLRLRKNEFLKIDFVALYNYKQKRGFFRFIPHEGCSLVKEMNKFIEAVGIDKNIIYHDKGFCFKFGIHYHTQRVKQRIEHIFGFKRYIYVAYKNGEIKNAKDLFDLYRKYLAKLNLEEV